MRTQFRDEYDALLNHFGGDTNPAETWLDSIAAFEKAAELNNKDEMHIYGITATDQELASELFSAFGGFFHQSYRDHDYLVGREKARAFIDRVNSSDAISKGDGIGPIRYTQRPPIPARPNLAGIKMSGVDRRKREALRERILSRGSRALEQAGLHRAIVAPLRWWFLRPKLNKLLEL